MLQALEEPDHLVEGVCKICTFRQISQFIRPCGHLSCAQCWNEWLSACRRRLEEQYRSARLVDRHMQKKSCMFCRTQVTKRLPAFYN